MIKAYMEIKVNLDEYISRIEQNDQELCVIYLESANLNNNDVELLMAKLKAAVNVGAKITGLYLIGNQLTSINIPAELSNLETLSLRDNQLTSINIPAELTNLMILSLSNNQLTSIDIPAELTNLTYLMFDDNQLTSVNIPVELTNITHIYLHDNQLTSINIPAELTKLHELHIDGNQLTMVTKIALASLMAARQNLNIHGLGNDVMEQLSPENLEEHFEVIVKKSLSEIKMAFRSCAIKATIKESIEVITKLPEYVIYSIINFINCSDKLLNENITILRRMFAKNELQLNILNAFLNSPEMITIKTAVCNAYNNEIARYLKIYSLNSKKILDMRNILRKREFIVSGIAALTCKPSLKEECLDCTRIDLEVNPFQITMRLKM
jgi:hypothetical protein